MTTLNAHFDGKTLVLDDPVPDGLPANARARVVLDEEPAPKPRCLEEIAKMARSMGLPPDFSVNFKHYTKGAPRR